VQPASPSSPVKPTAPPSVTAPSSASQSPAAIPGWLTYHNGTIGYTFDYPPEASLSVTGVASYPADEQPAGVDGDQYFATLEAKYAQGICAYVSLPTGTVAVSPAEEGAGRYSGPCGVSGIGVYDTRKEQAPVVVDGQSQTLMTTRLYEVGTETPFNE
jgi:hypothetical protein